MSILVINAGSSSVKFGLFGFDDLRPLARGLLDWAGAARQATITLEPAGGDAVSVRRDVPDYRSGVVAALEMLSKERLVPEKGSGTFCRNGPPGASHKRFPTPFPPPIRVVGHRLIHGGAEIRGPVRIDEAMKKTIARFAHLAPLHIPAGLEAIAATEAALPGAMLVGLFDTAFFADIPPSAYLYPVPYEWYEQWGIRRYGFHGTSHAYCTQRAAEMLARPATDLRLVICHLGQGGSATAVRGGMAITNTMGFTPLEGFMMGTRSGTVDPGILIHVLRERGLTVDQLDDVLHHKSGLLGISGVSSDFRQVEAAAAAGHARAQLALDVYAYRVRAMIGALAVTLAAEKGTGPICRNGPKGASHKSAPSPFPLDALVFTGGIGENSSWLRAEVCQGLECLGVRLDPKRNAHCRPDADVGADDSPARTLVIHTREDLMIARECRRAVLELPGPEARA